MLSTRSKSKSEVKKLAEILRYRGVRAEVGTYLAIRYDTQYIRSQLKQQDRDAKTKHYRSFAADLVTRIKKRRETPDFPVEEDPDRRPYPTCPFVNADEKCWKCFWYDGDDSTCSA